MLVNCGASSGLKSAGFKKITVNIRKIIICDVCWWRIIFILTAYKSLNMVLMVKP
jgi:hypothetical protein